MTLPTPLHDAAVAHLRATLPDEWKEGIRALIAAEGDSWPGGSLLDDKERAAQLREFGFCVPYPFHFSEGMGVRNSLREHVAKDSELPTGNWDDEYVALVELAVSGDG